jgi:predicted nucleic acid-binding protein
MVTTVLDASALVRFLDDEPGAELVERLINKAASGELTLLISAVNWGEVVYAVAHRLGLEAVRQLLNKLSNLQLTVAACTGEDAAEAALFKARFKIPYADAFAACLAIRNSAALITADYDFKTLPPEALKIEYLPAKPKSQ